MADFNPGEDIALDDFGEPITKTKMTLTGITKIHHL